jgi:hypothetical protein
MVDSMMSKINKVNKLRLSLGILCGLFLSHTCLNALTAHAGPFKITVTSYGKIDNDPNLADFKSQVNQIVTDLETQVNQSLPDASQSTYLKGMSNSNVIAVKGLGVDYASSPDIFVVGVGAGVGADIGNNKISDVTSGKVDANQITGIAAQPSIMVGVNLKNFPLPKLGFFDLKKLTVFGNFFSMKDIDKKINDGRFRGKLSNFGLHASYLVYEGMNIPWLFRWGGITLTSGFDMANFDVSYTKSFSQTQTKTATVTSPVPATATLNASFIGQAQAGAKISIVTVPIEVSTNVQLMHLFGLYGGLGMDLNFGSAKSIADLGGNINVTDSTGTVADNATPITATAALNLGDKGSPSSIDARWFLGTQLNVTLLKVYAQLNHGIGQSTWGANLGVRIAY